MEPAILVLIVANLTEANHDLHTQQSRPRVLKEGSMNIPPLTKQML